MKLYKQSRVYTMPNVYDVNDLVTLSDVIACHAHIMDAKQTLAYITSDEWLTSQLDSVTLDSMQSDIVEAESTLSTMLDDYYGPTATSKSLVSDIEDYYNLKIRKQEAKTANNRHNTLVNRKTEVKPTKKHENNSVENRIYNASLKIAYSCVRTMLNHAKTESAYNKMYALMRELRIIARHNATTQEEYETISRDIAKMQYKTEIAAGNIQKIKTRNYKMSTLSDGRRHKVEIIPEEYVINTEYERKVTANIQILDDYDAEDLVQIAYLQIWESIGTKVLNKEEVKDDDFYSKDTGAWKAVNNYVYRMRRDNERKEYIYYYDEDGNENAIPAKEFKNRILELEETETYLQLFNLIDKKLKTREEAEILRLRAEFELTYDEIAKIVYAQQYEKSKSATIMKVKRKYEKATKTVRNSMEIYEYISSMLG